LSERAKIDFTALRHNCFQVVSQKGGNSLAEVITQLHLKSSGWRIGNWLNRWVPAIWFHVQFLQSLHEPGDSVRHVLKRNWNLILQRTACNLDTNLPTDAQQDLHGQGQ
jgi:hypothetical protein